MKKIRISVLCGLLALVLAASAMAEPIISDGVHTAYLGRENYLFLTATGAPTRYLERPIIDLVGIDDTQLYCLTKDGRLFAVLLDGSSSTLVSLAPTEEDFARVAGEIPYTLEEGVLVLRNDQGAELSGIPGVASVCMSGNQLYFVADNGVGGYALKCVTLPVTGLEAPVPQVIRYQVSKPVSMTASPTAVTLVTELQTAEIIDLASLSLETVPLANPQATRALCYDGKLITYTLDEAGHYQVDTVTEHQLMSALPTATPAPTAAPTSAPTATPKPTVKPTATPKPSSSTSSDSEYSTLKKGAKGSAVRKMQKRLAALGYSVGAIDGVFGDDTLFAVNLFQCAIGYTEHTYASAAMQEKLYSRKAPEYDPYAPLKEGDKGADVRLMQTFLFDLGYTLGDKGIDGVYGKATKAAVERFQFVAGLEVTGEADADTLKRLYDVEDPVPNVTATPTPAPTATPAPVEPGTPTDLT